MKHFYEVFLSCKEQWADSSVVLNARKRSGTRRRGRYIWKKYHVLVEEQLGSCSCSWGCEARVFRHIANHEKLVGSCSLLAGVGAQSEVMALAGQVLGWGFQLAFALAICEAGGGRPVISANGLRL